MAKHHRMKNSLREGSCLENKTVEADQSWLFQMRLQKVTRMFEDIKVVAVLL